MTESRVYEIVEHIAAKHGCYDGFIDDIMDGILEYNDIKDLTEADVEDIAEDYFTED